MITVLGGMLVLGLVIIGLIIVTTLCIRGIFSILLRR